MGFRLTIELGNDAMLTGDDVADALERIVPLLRRGAGGHVAILDQNGNRVGDWSFDEEERCDHKWRRWPEFPDLESCRDCGSERVVVHKVTGPGASVAYEVEHCPVCNGVL